MTIYRGVVTQGGVDTFAADSITTGLTVDGKSGWEITGFKAFWSNGYTSAEQQAICNAVLATIATATLPNSADEIERVSWVMPAFFSLDPIRKAELTEPRVTVQPTIYVHANSTNTLLTNVLYYEIAYNIVKLSDLEVLRLLQGGA